MISDHDPKNEKCPHNRLCPSRHTQICICDCTCPADREQADKEVASFIRNMNKEV